VRVQLLRVGLPTGALALPALPAHVNDDRCEAPQGLLEIARPYVLW